jgi:hypothetical protein
VIGQLGESGWVCRYSGGQLYGMGQVNTPTLTGQGVLIHNLSHESMTKRIAVGAWLANQHISANRLSQAGDQIVIWQMAEGLESGVVKWSAGHCHNANNLLRILR